MSVIIKHFHFLLPSRYIVLIGSFLLLLDINTSDSYASYRAIYPALEKSSVHHYNRIIESNSLLFSFLYGDQSAVSLLYDVKPIIREGKISDKILRAEKEWKCRDGLVVTLYIKYYLDYSAAEWFVSIKNAGVANSKIISNLYSIDLLFLTNEEQSIIIHTNKGDDCTKYSFQPYKIILNKSQSESFYPTHENRPSGRSSTGPRGWPYWNIQNGEQGWIVALGWPGTWYNEICCDDNKFIKIKSGQFAFRAYLKPGEVIRTPLICVLPWEAKDIETSQNIWRHFYMDNIIPRFNGEPEKPALEIQAFMDEAYINNVQRYLDIGIRPRICWKDAGWYPTNTGKWDETGEWRLDTKKYPNGLSPFTRWARQHNMECLLWFEPERVKGDNTLSINHKEWLLTAPNLWSWILNIGNPKCLDWLISRYDSILTLNGLDWYREDMNEDPYRAWVQGDLKMGKDRIGVTENLYVQGHLRLWDILKSKHPNLHIDACASGGRRNDLETMHRAVPLLRSDYQWAGLGKDYIRGNQAHTWALSSWLPYQGSAVYEFEPYIFRSFYLPCFGMGSLRDDNIEAIKQGYTECAEIQPMLLYGDYWPLTSYSVDKDKWIGWQFDYVEAGQGCVQVFRRENCTEDSLCIKLRNLVPSAIYEVKNFDEKRLKTYTGESLMNGIYVHIKETPGSSILTYQRK